MNAKTTIRKITFIAFWLLVGGGMFTLLLAAISKKNKGICKDYAITIAGAKNNLFVDEKEVEKMLMKQMGGTIKGELVASFKLGELEQMLKRNTWISNAEIYFDNKDVLHISIEEKEPVARVFTILGNSFYLDSAGNKMPLSDKLSARVPVFTGFSASKKLTVPDSILLMGVTSIANYITKDSFWMAQVAQVDITADRNFEIIPTIGNHIVRMGAADNIERKFRRLMVFYKQVLTKTGFDKYKTIDVQYEGQVVVSRNADAARIDSAQLKSNIQKLIKQTPAADTVTRILKPTIKLEEDDEIKADSTLQDNADVNQEQNNPNTMKLSVPKKPNEERRPKAVMPKRVGSRE